MNQQPGILFSALLTLLIVAGCEIDIGDESNSSEPSKYHSAYISGLFKAGSSDYMFFPGPGGSIEEGKFVLIDLSGDPDSPEGLGGTIDHEYIDSDDPRFSGWYTDADNDKVLFYGDAEFASNSQYTLRFGREFDYARFDKVPHTQLLALTATEITSEVGCNDPNPDFEYDTETASAASGFLLRCSDPETESVGFTLGEYTYILVLGRNKPLAITANKND